MGQAHIDGFWRDRRSGDRLGNIIGGWSGVLCVRHGDDRRRCSHRIRQSRTAQRARRETGKAPATATAAEGQRAPPRRRLRSPPHRGSRHGGLRDAPPSTFRGVPAGPRRVVIAGKGKTAPLTPPQKRPSLAIGSLENVALRFGRGGETYARRPASDATTHRGRFALDLR
jgi:hypothetical protein